MKKQILIDISNKNRDRQVDSIKNEIRKYKKKLYWSNRFCKKFYKKITE